MTPMNPKSASALAWFALGVNILGLVVLALEAQFVFSLFAAILVLYPTIFSRNKARIFAGVVLILSLGLALAGYPKFAQSPYIRRASSATETMPAECLEFEHYPITEVYTGPFVEPDVNPPEVHHFRTRIREGSQGEPDFAGRFRVVSWGCGSNCHVYALVDKRTGKVYMAPAVAALDAEYRLNSGLFVLDPPRLIEESGSPLYATVSLVWDETSGMLRPISGCDG